MTLNELFQAADSIGNKYQDESYIQEYKAILADANKELQVEIEAYQPKGSLKAAIELCKDAEIEAMSIGDRTEFDLKVSNMVIPQVAKSRFGNLIAFLED